MEVTKVNLIESIGQVIKAIDDEVDWFLLYIREEDENQKCLFHFVYLSKCEELKKIVKEETKRNER